MTPIPALGRTTGCVMGFVTTVGFLSIFNLGCESLRSGPVATDQATASAAAAAPKRPSKHWQRVGQYVISTDQPVDANDALFHELGELPDQIQKELQLPAGEGLVQVFLFDTQEKYEAYMNSRYRGLPPRRAYFISEPRAGGGDELMVFTWMSENLRTDLRHELTHATLHGVLKGVPIWLDEGLAGFFELPTFQDGVNPAHLESLRRGPFQPDLARLEKLAKVGQMEKPEYREAWAWVHMMLRGGSAGKQVLIDYMQQLRTNPNPGPLQAKLSEAYPDPNQMLAEHLTRVEFPPLTPGAAAQSGDKSRKSTFRGATPYPPTTRSALR